MVTRLRASSRHGGQESFIFVPDLPGGVRLQGNGNYRT